jgi:hypothetical protein
MATLKHVGRIKNNKKKCCVVYRVLPGDPNTALVVLTQSLDASEHDALISLVDSSTAQQSDELGEAMARAQLPDGRNMLAGFHTTGKLLKVATDQVEMTPNNTTTVVLSVLNNAIAEQKGVTVNDLAIKNAQGQTVPEAKEDKDALVNTTDVYTNQAEGVLSDADLAKSYRSQADRLSKEAAQLRRQAEELVPTKKSAKTKESA